METWKGLEHYGSAKTSPTRLEGMETVADDAEMDGFGVSPTRLEGMETYHVIVFIPRGHKVSDPP